MNFEGRQLNRDEPHSVAGRQDIRPVNVHTGMEYTVDQKYPVLPREVGPQQETASNTYRDDAITPQRFLENGRPKL